MQNRYFPSAAIETLQLRSRLVASLRDFFRANGFWECETPILSREVVVDANLDPFITHDVWGAPYYLQTSPEAGMKRLLAAGATAIFQISRAMRRGESGRFHNPEFTMVEWYRVGDDHHDQMAFVEQLVRAFYGEARQLIDDRASGECRSALSEQPFERLTYDEAFERFAGSRVLHLSGQELRDLAVTHGVEFPGSLALDDRDGWLNVLLAELVEPNLGQDAPQFLYDYPASQAALALVRRNVEISECTGGQGSGTRDVAERFELYDQSVELCNGYHELTDPVELSRRIQAEWTVFKSERQAELPGAPLLETAMQAGLPECSGVALGLDRLVMLAIGKNEINDVIAFPADRA